MANISADPAPFRRPGGATGGHDTTRAVYTISVAAELSGMGVQALRLYESRGLIAPERTPGGTRRYSVRDLDRLERIAELIEAGVNLTGIGLVLALQEENRRLAAALAVRL